MRKSFLAFAPLALIAGPALANVDGNGDTGTVEVTGSVASKCLFTTPSSVIALGELAVTTGDSSAQGFLNNAAVNGKSATLKGWCNNANAQIHVLASALIGEQEAEDGFTNRIDFSATAKGATDSTTDAEESDEVDVGMFTGDVQVTLSDSDATGLLTAGAYAGSVKVFLNPKAVPAAAQPE